MLKPVLETTIEEIAETLKERRSQGQRTVFFLGARAGEFYDNDDFYQAMRRRIRGFKSLTDIEKFQLCYEILSKHHDEKKIHTILTTASPKNQYREEDELLAELVQAGFCDMIITTHIGTLLENAFVPASMKEPEDYQVIIAGVHDSEAIFGSKPRYCRIIRIFGDLDARKYRTAGNAFDLEEDRVLKGFLEAVLQQRNTIFIGYDPIWDQGIEKAFLPAKEMLWYINEELPQEDSHLANVLKQRRGKYLAGPQASYREFIRALYNFIGGGVNRQPTSELAPAAPQTAPPARKKVFICYSHEDTRYQRRLLAHLKGYLHVTDFLNIWTDDIWHDQRIETGEDWREKIKNALASTRVAILLVSADFLASDFIRDYELPVLLNAADAGEVKLLPVVIGPCNIKHTKLDRYQLVNDASGRLMNMSRYERELLWSKLAEQVFEILSTA